MKRKNKTSLIKKWIKFLPGLFSVLVVLYLGVLIKDIEVPDILPVEDIHVQGELRFLDSNVIKSMVENNISGGYFTVDLDAVRNLLLQKPWVKEVSLRRVWPAGLNVIVEEQVPVAYWNNNAYLSEKGDVFEPELIDNKLNLPTLNGPEGQHNNVWKFMNILYKETALLNYEVVRLDYDERRAWRLIVIGQDDNNVNQIDVKLGRFDTEKRLRRFVRVLPALAMQGAPVENRIRVIDMRYPNGFAVRMTAGKVVSSFSGDYVETQVSVMTNQIIINNKTKKISQNRACHSKQFDAQVCEV